MTNNNSRKKLLIIFSIALTLILTLTVVYAALATTLNITGNAQVSSANWDIKLNNAQVKEGSVSETAPVITGNTKASFSTTLNMPGDFYEFTIDVVNNGTIDAMIDSVEKKPTLTEEQAKFINYIIEYENGTSITNKQLVSAGAFVRLKVKVEFRKDISSSDLPTSQVVLDLAFNVNYTQADENGTSVNDNGVYKTIRVVNGNIDTIGSEVCIGDECFYVISSDSANVTMIAKYNLYVGSECYNSTCTPYGEEATGLQSPSAIGGNSPTSVGIVDYSNSEMMGEYYSDYTGSIVENYVNNYETKLTEKYNIDVVEARIITYDELTNQNTFACIEYDACSENYPFIYSTSYWTNSPDGEDDVWYITSNNVFDSTDMFSALLGVRPVIVISKDYF